MGTSTISSCAENSSSTGRLITTLGLHLTFMYYSKPFCKPNMRLFLSCELSTYRMAPGAQYAEPPQKPAASSALLPVKLARGLIRAPSQLNVEAGAAAPARNCPLASLLPLLSHRPAAPAHARIAAAGCGA